MDRSEFLSKLGRYILLLLLVAAATAMGRKAVSGPSCSGCPGKGICNGNSDCQSFLSTK